MALFGGGSFLDTRFAHPSAYPGMHFIRNYTSDTSKPANTHACASLSPMGRLFGTEKIGTGHSVDRWCLRNEDGGESDGSGQGLSLYISDWILYFNASTTDQLSMLSNTFTVHHCRIPRQPSIRYAQQ